MPRRHTTLSLTRCDQILVQAKDQTAQRCTAFSTITEQNTQVDDRGKQCIQVRAEVRKERLVSGFKATAPVGLHSFLAITKWPLIAEQSRMKKHQLFTVSFQKCWTLCKLEMPFVASTPVWMSHPARDNARVKMVPNAVSRKSVFEDRSKIRRKAMV